MTTSYERPMRLALLTQKKQAEIDYILWFAPAPAGTLMRWSGEVRPKGAFRLLTPVIGWLGARHEQRIRQSMKRHSEVEPIARD